MYDYPSSYEERPLIPGTSPNKPNLNVAWLAVILILSMTIINSAAPAAAIIALVILAFALTFREQCIRAIVRWREKRRIASQPNAHQRGYILQRLRHLPYENDTYSTRDLTEDKTLIIRHYLDEEQKTVFLIEFVENEYLGPADIGNEYRRTRYKYFFSPRRSTIRHEKFVGLRYSGSIKYHTHDTKVSQLDHLPDGVIEQIEHALLNWIQVTTH